MSNKWIEWTELEVGRLYVERLKEEFGPGPGNDDVGDNTFLVMTTPKKLEFDGDWGAKVMCQGGVIDIERSAYINGNKKTRKNGEKFEHYCVYQEVTNN